MNQTSGPSRFHLPKGQCPFTWMNIMMQSFWTNLYFCSFWGSFFFEFGNSLNQSCILSKSQGKSWIPLRFKSSRISSAVVGFPNSDTKGHIISFLQVLKSLVSVSLFTGIGQLFAKFRLFLLCEVAFPHFLISSSLNFFCLIYFIQYWVLLLDSVISKHYAFHYLFRSFFHVF